MYMLYASNIYLDYLIVLLAPVLGDQVNLVVQAEQEKDGLLPGDSSHVHVVHFDDLVARLETLLGSGTAWLDGRHKDAHIVATRQPNPHRTLFLEADEARIRQGALGL